MENKSPLAEQIVRHEGIRLKPYSCPAGALSIGIGRNLDAKGITKAEAFVMLEADIKDARFDVDMILDIYKIKPWILNPAWLDALANMAFNMGQRKLMGFKRLFSFIKDEDFGSTAAEILDSKYARDVGVRAVELVEQMKNGVYR